MCVQSNVVWAALSATILDTGGRIAVHEILAINQDIRRMIMEHESVENITKYAREHQHMRTLKESGLILVKEGVTTPEELMKISYE